jgi:hypothetical protein
MTRTTIVRDLSSLIFQGWLTGLAKVNHDVPSQNIEVPGRGVNHFWLEVQIVIFFWVCPSFKVMRLDLSALFRVSKPEWGLPGMGRTART